MRHVQALPAIARLPQSNLPEPQFEANGSHEWNDRKLVFLANTLQPLCEAAPIDYSEGATQQLFARPFKNWTLL